MMRSLCTMSPRRSEIACIAAAAAVPRWPPRSERISTGRDKRPILCATAPVKEPFFMAEELTL